MNLIVGIDEAGRGAWAGPLVAAAVALDDETYIPKLNDSKKLTKKQRSEILVQIQKAANSIGIGWVDARAVDKHGLSRATSMAMREALDQINCDFNLVIIDGNIDYLTGRNFRCEVKADQKYAQVSAASIIAKVARDRLMTAMSLVYPDYGFNEHAGYGTKKHIQALKDFGVTAIHRLSYKPVKAIHVNSIGQTGRTSRT